MKLLTLLLLLPVLLFSCHFWDGDKPKKMPSSYMIICSNGVCDTISVDTSQVYVINPDSIEVGTGEGQTDTLYADTLANGRYFDKWGNKYDSNGVLLSKEIK